MKKVIVILLIVVPTLLLYLSNVLSLVSGLKSSGSIRVDGSMNIADTAVIKSMQSFSKDYMAQIEKTMDQMEQEIIQQYTVYENVVNTETQETEVKAANTIIVTKSINEFNYSMLFAYLKCSDGVDEDNGEINTDQAKEFMDKICSIKQEQVSETEFTLTNVYMDENKIAKEFFKNEKDRSMFLASYNAYKTLLSSSTVIGPSEDTGEAAASASFMVIPLYLQYSGTWSNVAYGDGTISQNGCAPTCLAMVMSYMRQQSILPSKIVSYTGNRYYVNGQGSSWGIFDAVAANYGVACQALGKNQTLMLTALSSGKPVIASMGPGEFTKAGHFIVLTGITADGEITVNDPNDNATKNHKGRSFPVALIMRESKSFWSFG